MTTFLDIKSHTIKILESDIDTDQIIPARFLRTLASEGLGRYLFYDRRYSNEGMEIADFPLSTGRYQGETILIAGDNFGCGSSREHAPWALKDFGIRAIVGRSFADIFFNNCLLNGLLPIVVDQETWQLLIADGGMLCISLASQSLHAEHWCMPFALDPFARHCLLHGFSELDYIVRNNPAITAFETANKVRFPSLATLLNFS